MKKIKIWHVLIVLFFLTAVTTLRPVPIVKESEFDIVEGVVVNVFESGAKDVSILLEGDDRKFYINRGLENGLELNSLTRKLMGNKVVMKYPSYWTPLNPFNSVRHISKLSLGEEVLFDETLKE